MSAAGQEVYAEEKQEKKDLKAKRVRNIESRLLRARDLAITLSNPHAAKAELGIILGDPNTYAAVMINHHLYSILTETMNIINRKAQERYARMEEMGKRERVGVR